MTLFKRSGAPGATATTIDTAAVQGKTHHENLYEAIARSAHLRKLLILVLLAILVWDRIELSFIVGERQYAPVILHETEDGTLRYKGTPDVDWKPSDRNTIAELRWVIQTIRGRTVDAQFDQKLWQRLHDHSTDKAKMQMQAAYDEQQALLEKGRIVIEWRSINKVSETQFDIRWEERRHDQNNAWNGKSPIFRGLFMVVTDVPRTLPGWQLNETGVWIDGWSIAPEVGLEERR